MPDYKNGPVLSYLRAFLIVVVFYGLDFVLNYWKDGRLAPGDDNPGQPKMITWAVIQAAWLMGILYFPLPLYYFSRGQYSSLYFSTEMVFRWLLVALYGTIGVLGLLAVAMGSRYGGMISLGLLLMMVLAGRGFRLRRLVEYGTTCASLFVFYLASAEVPAHLWLWFYVGLGLVQALFLAGLSQVFSDIFSPDNRQDSW